MNWCRFSKGDKTSYGTVENNVVTEVEGTPWGQHKVTKTTYPLDSIKLLVPVIPNTFFCIGQNYKAHIIDRAKARGVEPKFPEKPDIGYRANNALIAHGENIVKPADSTDVFQYEGELVAVFGKKAKNVSEKDALDYVFGWTIGNDVSERTWQYNDRSMWRAKNSDTFKPMGPWITTGLSVSDLEQMYTTIRVNGTQTDKFHPWNMLFSAATYISELSKYVEIQPGDVMWMGTDGDPRNLKPGDVVEIELTGIGVLRNPIVAGK